MADRMLWPPSLSRDGKWPRPTKCMHSRVVGLRLKRNLVLVYFVGGCWGRIIGVIGAILPQLELLLNTIQRRLDILFLAQLMAELIL